jgi:hypothetical protein
MPKLHDIAPGLALVAAVLLGPSLVSAQDEPAFRGQDVSDLFVVDHDWRFRFELPAPGWRLRGEADLAGLGDDDVAGAIGPEGIRISIFVFPCGDAGLEQVAKDRANTLSGLGLATRVDEAANLAGGPARHLGGEGVLRGLRARMDSVLAVQGGFAWIVQVLDMAVAEGESADDTWRRAAAAFSRMEGPVVPRPRRRPQPDVNAAGWRILSGRFESADHGFVVEAPDGFRLAVGTELEMINPEADVGLIGLGNEIQVLLLCEPGMGYDREAIVPMLREGLVKTAGMIDTGRDIEVQIGAGTAPARVYEYGDGSGRAAIHAVGFSGDRMFQVVGDVNDAKTEQGIERFRAALRAVRILSEEERQSLVRSVAEGPGPGNRAGDGFSIRHGIFRDFRHGVVLRPPRGFLWDMSPPAAQHDADPMTRLLLRDERDAVTVALLVEPNGRRSLAAAHKERLRIVLDGDEALVRAAMRARPERVPFGSIPGLSSTVVRDIGTMRLGHVVRTASASGMAFHLVATGVEDHMKAAGPALDALFASVEAPVPGLPDFVQGDAAIVDHRMGFAWDFPDPGWTCQEATPPEIAAAGAVRLCSKGPALFAVWALSVLAAEADERAVSERLLDEAAAGMAGRLGLSEGALRARAPGALGGREVNGARWANRKGRFDVRLGRDGETVYMVGVAFMGEGSGTNEAVDRMFSKFRYLP